MISRSLWGVPAVFVRVCACVLASRAKRVRRWSPTGHCELRVLVQCSCGTEGSDDPCSRAVMILAAAVL